MLPWRNQLLPQSNASVPAHLANQREKAEATTADTLGAIFTALRAILRIFQEEFVVKADRPNHCSLETRSPSLNGRRLFFAAAKVKKNYVSYYLPALYMFPELAKNGRRLFFAAAKVKKNYVSYYLPALYMFPELANRISP